MESGLGEITVVIRDSEQLTGGGNPSASRPGILLCLLVFVVCSVSTASLPLLFLLLLLLTDASAFVSEVPKVFPDIDGVGVLHVDTDTSVCVALITVWGGVDDLGGRCIGPQLRDGCKEGIGSLCELFRSLIHGGVHGGLSNGGE